MYMYMYMYTVHVHVHVHLLIENVLHVHVCTVYITQMTWEYQFIYSEDM